MAHKHYLPNKLLWIVRLSSFVYDFVKFAFASTTNALIRCQIGNRMIYVFDADVIGMMKMIVNSTEKCCRKLKPTLSMLLMSIVPASNNLVENLMIAWRKRIYTTINIVAHPNESEHFEFAYSISFVVCISDDFIGSMCQNA